jgi:hypothetical protein
MKRTVLYMSLQTYRLGDLLINKHIISASQLDDALRYQQKNGIQIGQALIQMGHVTQRQINQALKKQNYIRLCAAVAAFFMAPFSVCNANTDSIEQLPEYSLTQIAETQYSDEYSFNSSQISVGQNGEVAGINILEITTATVWYLSQGGLNIDGLQAVPLNMNITALDNSYTVNMNLSF